MQKVIKTPTQWINICKLLSMDANWPFVRFRIGRCYMLRTFGSFKVWPGICHLYFQQGLFLYTYPHWYEALIKSWAVESERETGSIYPYLSSCHCQAMTNHNIESPHDTDRITLCTYVIHERSHSLGLGCYHWQSLAYMYNSCLRTLLS